MSERISSLAEILDNAAATATATPQISAQEDISLEDAYVIQRASIARRLTRGENLVGVKMGFTSRAKMEQMGVHDMIWGRLTDAMIVEDGGEIDRAKFVHPRVEPEIAFLLKAPLKGKVSLAQASAAIEAAAPALEIIDSRYRDFKFSLTDVVADNSSSSGFVVGAWRKPDFDLSNLGMIMSVNGHMHECGSSAAILGNPLRSLAAAARLAGDEVDLDAGSIIMAGGATAAVALQPGDIISLEVEKLGVTGFKVRA